MSNDNRLYIGTQPTPNTTLADLLKISGTVLSMSIVRATAFSTGSDVALKDKLKTCMHVHVLKYCKSKGYNLPINQ